MRRLRANAALFWRWFGYWRKRYMWLRLAILLVIFAPTLKEIRHPLIGDLVRYAITAIETARFPPSFMEARLLRARETKRLQESLLARFDSNHDGRLEPAEAQRLGSATGLAPKALRERVLSADYDRLLAATKKVGIATRFATSREMRRWAFETARANEEREFAQYHREIDAQMRIPYARPADYLRWTTWRRGLGMFWVGWQEIVQTGLGPLGSFAPGINFSMQALPGTELSAQTPRLVWAWRGGIGWLMLLVLVIISARGFARRQELERRFKEDPAFAEAPCPICGRPTHDFGALRELRLTRAIGVGAVVGLAAFAVGTLGLHDALERTVFAIHLTPIVFGVVVAAARYLLWPWEVHACHRRPGLHIIGIAAAVVAVIVALGAVVAYGVTVLG